MAQRLKTPHSNQKVSGAIPASGQSTGEFSNLARPNRTFRARSVRVQPPVLDTQFPGSFPAHFPGGLLWCGIRRAEVKLSGTSATYGPTGASDDASFRHNTVRRGRNGKVSSCADTPFGLHRARARHALRSRAGSKPPSSRKRPPESKTEIDGTSKNKLRRRVNVLPKNPEFRSRDVIATLSRDVTAT
ncbi:hypothetical protein EVAR_103191_1 [Eumeta japonica]|uniref:Uncharacterized protein n=1 Tax=Eumeta variegata TaxID=151549 RepID=A0A4C1YGG6_EUMVA|nr:hypothetical protein EVAR_103191_1 [Eumeta japonica]